VNSQRNALQVLQALQQFAKVEAAIPTSSASIQRIMTCGFAA
jgi:hypothetical protein